MQIYLTCSSGN